MASPDFLHNHPDFSDLLRIVAGEMSIDPVLVEKDYWIMHCLYELQRLGLSFELKGGTSLSKGYGIIHRFSEDIHTRQGLSNLTIPKARDPSKRNSQYLLSSSHDYKNDHQSFLTHGRERNKFFI